jgi:two-component system, NtrC family, response regulator AtoC
MSGAAAAPPILLVNPDPSAVQALASLLAGRGIGSTSSASGTEALSSLDFMGAKVVLCTLTLPDMKGSDLLGIIAERWPGVPVVMLAPNASVPEAIAAMRAGAADFLQLPVDPDELFYVVEKALAAVERLAEQPPPPSSRERARMLGDSPAMRQVFATVECAAQGVATVLVRGESGTGKELIARAIHELSPRRGEPFVKIDCASLPENLLESELFGYERGAFTGAAARKPGRAELADRGTLFLDEIGELTLPLQAKLLRLLQDRKLERVGGTKAISVDLRVVAATHGDLDGMVERGQFRRDLCYRLNVIPIWLPPLRERREDIEALAQHFCLLAAAANGRTDSRLSPEALRTLRAQTWPGNVRQLQNFIERLVVLNPKPVLDEADVQGELSRQVTFATHPETNAGGSPLAAPTDAGGVAAGTEPAMGPPSEASPSQVVPLDATLRAAEKVALERALRHAKQNRSLAARLLGLSRSTLYIKLREHDLL